MSGIHRLFMTAGAVPTLGLLLSLFLGSPLEARWSHFPPVQAPAGQLLRLEFLDPEGVQAPDEVLLHAEVGGRSLNPISSRDLSAGRVVFLVPAELLVGTELAYWVEIRSGQTRQRLPESGQWRLSLAPERELALVELLSEGQVLEGEETLLAFSALGDLADLSTGQIWINGKPAPGAVEADPWLLTWRGMLPAGRHQVELRLKDKSGRDLQPQRLDVQVHGADLVAMGFEGSAWQEFNMDFQDSRGDQWQRYHAGNMRFRAYRGQGDQAWNLRGRVLLSALDLESDEIQPQSRLTLDLDHKGFLLGVGDRQPEYSPVMLSGTRVRGVELQVDARQFGLRAVGGRSMAPRDPVFGISDGSPDFSGAFARNLYAVDLRMGRRYGLVEGGFTVLKVKDVENSIDALPPDSWGTDSLARISPQDNVAVGMRLDVNAFRGRFSVRNQAAFSMHNSNISGGPWTKADLDSLGAGDLPDPSNFEDIIVINSFFSPMDLVDGDVMNATALFSNWNWNMGINEILLDFRRVGGAYVSLGNSFLTPDRQEIRVTDRFRVLQNQLYIDLGGALATDNLDGQFDNTVGTTARNTFSLGLGWYPQNRDLQVRIGLEQQSEANEALDLLPDNPDVATEDNARSQQIEGSLNQLRLGVTGSLNWLERRHQWSVNLVNQSYGDDVGEVMDAGDLVRLRSDRSFGSNQVSLGWQVDLIRRLRLDAGISIYQSDYDAADQSDYGYWSLRAAVGRGWLGGKLQSTVRMQLQDVTSESAATSASFMRTDLGGEIGYTLRRGLGLSSRLDWQSWSGDREDSFMKVVMRLSQEF